MRSSGFTLFWIAFRTPQDGAHVVKAAQPETRDGF
jgi:hypothetical protein